MSPPPPLSTFLITLLYILGSSYPFVKWKCVTCRFGNLKVTVNLQTKFHVNWNTQESYCGNWRPLLCLHKEFAFRWNLCWIHRFPEGKTWTLKTQISFKILPPPPPFNVDIYTIVQIRNGFSINKIIDSFCIKHLPYRIFGQTST